MNRKATKRVGEERGARENYHDEGTSTDVTGREVSCKAVMIAGNGSRISPEKENPVSQL
jgi:hypothetical protein